MTYYNTTKVKGKDLKKYSEKANTQYMNVQKIFKEYLVPMKASEVYKIYTREYGEILRTSVRRCLTNLCDSGVIERLDYKLKSDYNRPEGVYKLSSKRIRMNHKKIVKMILEDKGCITNVKAEELKISNLDSVIRILTYEGYNIKDYALKGSDSINRFYILKDHKRFSDLKDPIETITDYYLECTGSNLLYLKDKSRRKDYVDERMTYVYCVYTTINTSDKSIGKVINRDRTSVIHLKEKALGLHQTYEDEAKRLDKISLTIRLMYKDYLFREIL